MPPWWGYVKRLLKKKIQCLSDNSNLDILGYVLTPSPIPRFRRFFWFCVLSACCYCAASVLIESLKLYSNEAVSYTVETNYLEWDTPFPAVTICETDNDNRVKALLIKNNLSTSLTNFARDVSFWNAKYCKSCSTCKNHTCLSNFTDLVNTIRLNCSDILKECWWNDKAFPCCDRFRPLATEYGTCYTFNSRLTGNSTLFTVNRRVGLPRLVFTTSVAFSIRIHSPGDIVSVAVDNTAKTKCASLPLISDYETTLLVEQTISDASVNSIPPDSRDCLFSHERLSYSEHWPFATYSYSACVLHCRAMCQYEHCNCTHHLMPRKKEIPPCDIDGLICLYNHKDQIAKVTCDCPMDCEELTYKPSFVYCPRHMGADVPQELVERGTRGQIWLGQLPTLRVRRHAIRELLGFVVDFGGVIGVFFGASILSLIEIIYLLCIRREK